MSHNNPDSFTLNSFFTSENIIACSHSMQPNEVFSELLKNLALTYGIGNVKQIYSGFVKKNGQLSPQIINNFALIQHFRISGTDDIRLAIAFVKEGIEYVFDKKTIKIHLFLLITSPKKRPDLYLRVLKSLKLLINDNNFISEVLKNPDSGHIWNLINQKSINIPPYILASDIMQDPQIVIKEENNLEDAIDLFTKSNCISIPVIDKDGDLLGEVTLQELMRVCLPRYILWMDDISPTLNFEPFRNMLHNESNTWLDEIMTQDIARVHLDDPAIIAGIEMTKLSVDHAYVIDDKKLAGIISLQQLVFKVLRE